MEFSLDTSVLFRKGKAGLLQSVYVTVDPPVVSGRFTLSLETEDWKREFSLDSMMGTAGVYRIEVPEIRRDTACTAELRTGTERITREVPLKKRRKWEVHVENFSHTDIGYTDLPSRVAKSYEKALKSILAYCDQTADMDEASRYKWNVETGYWLEKALSRLSGEERSRVKDLVKEGRIEICPLYVAHTSEFNDEETLIRSMEFAFCFARECGVQIQTAMASDSTGQPFFFPQMLAKSGIKYFSTSVNATMAKALRLPRPFYWQGPDGSKVLLLDTDERQAYQEGVMTGISESYEKALRKLPLYLADLEDDGKYLFDLIAFRTPGHPGDNSLPNIDVSYIVRQWNDEWEFPKLRISTYSVFFEQFEKTFGRELKTFTGAWPDWWVLYNGASAFETGVNRHTHSGLIDAERLSALTSFADASESPEFEYPAEELDEAYKTILLADEADWGSYSSVSEPDGLQARGQKFEEAAFVYQAAINAEELAANAAERIAVSGRGKKNGLLVFNSLSWERSALVKTDIPPSYGMDKDGIAVLDTMTGESVPCQFIEQDRDTVDLKILFRADGIPALGFKAYQIVPSDISTAVRLPVNGELENQFYRLQYNPETAVITAIIDKDTGSNIIDTKSPYLFNELIYEYPKQNRNVELKHHTALPENVLFLQPHYRGLHDFYDYPRSDNPLQYRYAGKGRVVSASAGPVRTEIVFEYSAHMCPKVISTICLDNCFKRISVENYIEKTETLDPEGLYSAFPFNARNPEIHLDAHGGHYRPELGQLPGSSKDWYCSQKWVDISGEENEIIWSAVEAPLIQLSSIQTGKWLEELSVENGTIFSFMMNNYWWTNSSASQGGRFRFTYSFTSGPKGFRPAAADRFGWSEHVPLRTALTDRTDSFSLLAEPLPENIILIGLRKAGTGKNGFVLRLLENSGREVDFSLSFNGKKLQHAAELTPAEDFVSDLSVSNGKTAVHAGAFELVTILCDFG